MYLLSFTALLAVPVLAQSFRGAAQQQALIEGDTLALDNKLSKVIKASPFLSLHRSLCETESISNNEYDVGLWLSNFLEAHNFTVVRQEVPSQSKNDGSKLRWNIYATPNKALYESDVAVIGTPKVLLSSHIDTVPPFIPYSLSVPNTKTQKFSREDILISGRGTVDAKACVAAQITAVMDLITDPDFKEQASDLALLFVVGEENSGDGMKTFSNSKLYHDTKSDYKSIIFGEPTESKLASGHKGIFMLHIEAHGKAAHSGYPWLGRSANSMILPTLMVLDMLGSLPKDKGGLPGSEMFGNTTVNVGYISGGVAANVVPEYAEAGVSFRLAGGTVDECKDIVKNAIRAADPDELLEYEFRQGYGPVYLDDDVPGFEKITVNYGTDVPNIVVDEGVKRYLYGPGSILVAHGKDEGLTVGELEQSVEDYKKLIRHALEL